MENIEISNYINNLISDSRKELEKLNSQLIKIINYDEIINMSSSELREVLEKYNISDIDEVINDFENLKYFKGVDSFSATFEQINININKVISIINYKIQEINNKIFTIEKSINNYQIILDLFNGECICTNEEFNDIIIVLISLEIPDKIKFAISRRISENHLKNASKKEEAEIIESVDRFEEKAKECEESATRQQQTVDASQSISELRREMIKYVEEIENQECFKDVKNYENDELYIEYSQQFIKDNRFENADDFFAKMGAIHITNIKNFNLKDDDVANDYRFLKEMVNLYNESAIRKEELLSILDEIYLVLNSNSDLKTKFSYNIDESILGYKFVINNTFILYEDDKIISDIDNIYDQISKYINDTTLEGNDTKIKSFKSIVLFAQDNNHDSYFEKDLFGNSSIDENTHSNDNENCLSTFNSLILDLFKYGMPSSLLKSNSSSKAGKILRTIFRKDHKGRKNKNNPSDMYRIRPFSTSITRFSERKIVISNNKKLYYQIRDIIFKYFPNIEIDEKEIGIYINVAAGVKIKDDDLYDISNKRYDRGIELLELFFKEGIYDTRLHPEMKTEFNEEELELFERYVRDTVRLLQKLQKDYSEFNFSELGLGGKTNELL